jgi:exo-beta-1,3-glucanase (GH17 family)
MILNMQIAKMTYREVLGFILFFMSIACSVFLFSCDNKHTDKTESKINLSTGDILGDPGYHAICYGGYRGKTLEEQPSIEELKDDILIMHAAGVRFVRTYKLMYPHAENLIKAIRSVKEEDPEFEMYVMLGAWINCKDAFTANPVHNEESPQNAEEITRAIRVANTYPDIVKVIAVGNEAMVHWQAGYFVTPAIILKWVNHLQRLKSIGKLNKDVWITCSDNFASWGGGGEEYHNDDLVKLIKAVDYVSMHTYPMHDTHYNPEFWLLNPGEQDWEEDQRIDTLMLRSLNYAKSQYKAVVDYISSHGLNTPVHIGETGWASSSNGHYGPDGSKACDEYKQKIFYDHVRKWTDEEGISCFYFQAFDEPWKDAQNPGGSENHFGLFTVEGKAKYPMWDLVDQDIFNGLGRGGQSVNKTFGGDKNAMMHTVSVPDLLIKEKTMNDQ